MGGSLSMSRSPLPLATLARGILQLEANQERRIGSSCRSILQVEINTCFLCQLPYALLSATLSWPCDKMSMSHEMRKLTYKGSNTCASSCLHASFLRRALSPTCFAPHGHLCQLIDFPTIWRRASTKQRQETTPRHLRSIRRTWS